jgi:hypothetical protein
MGFLKAIGFILTCGALATVVYGLEDCGVFKGSAVGKQCIESVTSSAAAVLGSGADLLDEGPGESTAVRFDAFTAAIQDLPKQLSVMADDGVDSVREGVAYIRGWMHESLGLTV